jgi:hypothetical protein
MLRTAASHIDTRASRRQKLAAGVWNLPLAGRGTGMAAAVRPESIVLN